MVKENIEKVKNEIIKQFPNGNKYGEAITIVAASKTIGIDILNELKPLGISICAENRVQEFLQKYEKVETSWHFIGNLQTNKVKYIVGKVDLIQSCNSLKLLQEIDRLSKKAGIISNVLIEVNIACEDSKTGISSQLLAPVLNESKNLKNILIKGLMAVMPYSNEPLINADYYLQMRSIYDKIRLDKLFKFEYLSMGMSNDYMTAIENGSNMIRLGTCIFGKRLY